MSKGPMKYLETRKQVREILDRYGDTIKEQAKALGVTVHRVRWWYTKRYLPKYIYERHFMKKLTDYSDTQLVNELTKRGYFVSIELNLLGGSNGTKN